jgi:hypothetical protein
MRACMRACVHDTDWLTMVMSAYALEVFTLDRKGLSASASEKLTLTTEGQFNLKGLNPCS